MLAQGHFLFASMCSSRSFLSSRVGCLEWNYTLQQHLEDLRLNSQRWNRFSALSVHVSGSASSWPSPGKVDGSTATGSHDKGSSEEGRTRRRLDTFSNLDDENARRAVLSLANNAMQACPLGSKRHLQQPICLQPMCPSGFTAKQVTHLLDSCLAREPNAKSLWQHTEMMVFRTQLRALFVTQVPPLLFVNPSHQKTQKSEDVLNRSGRLWVQN